MSGARRLRRWRAAVRRANHRAVSMHGVRQWVGDAYVIPSSIYGAVWRRDTRLSGYAPGRPGFSRAGFILTRHPKARP